MTRTIIDTENPDGRPATEAEEAEFDARDAAWVPPAPTPKILTKNTVFRRMTEDELRTFAAAFSALPLIDQLLFNHAQSNEIDPKDPQIIAFLSSVFSPSRAAELLAV